MSTKRRTFSAAFKAEVVLQLLSGVKTQAQLCREHELAPQLLLQWKQTFQQNAASVFASNEQNSAEAIRIAELERALGRATLENDILKKASSLLGRKRGGTW
jgi:transposase